MGIKAPRISGQNRIWTTTNATKTTALSTLSNAVAGITDRNGNGSSKLGASMFLILRAR